MRSLIGADLLDLFFYAFNCVLYLALKCHEKANRKMLRNYNRCS